MIPTSLLVYCLVAGGLYLIVITAVIEFLGGKLKVTRGMPPGILEATGFGWHLLNYIMDLLLFVAVPTFAHALFYLVLPLEGMRTGLAAAVFAFTLGAVPAVVGFTVRTRLPVLFFLYYLFGVLLKLGGALAIIGYLYSL